MSPSADVLRRSEPPSGRLKLDGAALSLTESDEFSSLLRCQCHLERMKNCTDFCCTSDRSGLGPRRWQRLTQDGLRHLAKRSSRERAAGCSLFSREWLEQQCWHNQRTRQLSRILAACWFFQKQENMGPLFSWLISSKLIFCYVHDQLNHLNVIICWKIMNWMFEWRVFAKLAYYFKKMFALYLEGYECATLHSH